MSNGLFLSDLQIRMLEAKQFHLDGWHKAKSHEAAADLLRLELVTVYQSGSDEQQYTALNYTRTELGTRMLEEHQKLKATVNI